MMTLAERERNYEVGITTDAIERTKEQLDLLERLVKTVLRKDEDYGIIPGTGNKQGTLLKPGAANVTAAFNCHAEPFIDMTVVDPSMGSHGFVNYEVHVDLINNGTGMVMSRGYGSANSYESKYRYRYAKPRCPQCGEETVLESKTGTGYFCWRKLGGCGATFRPGDPAIEAQAVGKVENENPLDMANTIKKMAVKRAEVDAAMRLPGVARFFTQDLEEIESTHEEPARAATEAVPGAASKQPEAPTPETSDKLTNPGSLFNACKQQFGITSVHVLTLLSQIEGREIKSARQIEDFERAWGEIKAHFADKGIDPKAPAAAKV